jgi:hypothetical protein
MFNGTMFPLVYALLLSKSEEDYSRMLNRLDLYLATKGLVLNPQAVVLDYELAAHNAWRNSRPATQLKGCMFNFGQCVWRKIQSVGLQHVYAIDGEFQAWARLILSLPLLPTYEIQNQWIRIVERAPIEQHPAAQVLCDYMSNFWINDNSATFAIPVWNHFATDGPRTTNHIEGWHKKLNGLVGHPHPNVFRIIGVFQKEQQMTAIKMIQAQHGVSVPRRKKKYVDVDNRIRNLKLRLINDDCTVDEFATAISHLLGF